MTRRRLIEHIIREDYNHVLAGQVIQADVEQSLIQNSLLTLNIPLPRDRGTRQEQGTWAFLDDDTFPSNIKSDLLSAARKALQEDDRVIVVSLPQPPCYFFSVLPLCNESFEYIGKPVKSRTLGDTEPQKKNEPDLWGVDITDYTSLFLKGSVEVAKVMSVEGCRVEIEAINSTGTKVRGYLNPKDEMRFDLVRSGKASKREYEEQMIRLHMIGRYGHCNQSFFPGDQVLVRRHGSEKTRHQMELPLYDLVIAFREEDLVEDRNGERVVTNVSAPKNGGIISNLPIIDWKYMDNYGVVGIAHLRAGYLGREEEYRSVCVLGAHQDKGGFVQRAVIRYIKPTEVVADKW